MADNEEVVTTDIGEEEETPQLSKTDEGTEPQVRKSASFYYEQRQERKRSKPEAGNKKGDEDDLEEIVGRKVQEIVSKAIEPLAKTINSQAINHSDEKELTDVYEKYPQARAYDAEIRKYINHKSYSEVAIENIVLSVAARRLGLVSASDKADLQKKVDEEAKRNTAGAGSRRPTSTDDSKLPDAFSLSDDDFKKKVEEVRRKGLD